MRLRSHSLPKINIKCFVRKGGLVLVALLFITNYILDRDGLLFLPLFVYPVALYTTTDSGYAPNCCLANHLLRTLGRVEIGCSLARIGDWVLLPPDLDIGGAFRTELNVFTDDAVEELGRLAKVSERMVCMVCVGTKKMSSHLPNISQKNPRPTRIFSTVTLSRLRQSLPL